MMAAAVFEINDVCFHRQGRSILKNISWTVEQGQHWVLLGANGSGKTTLLKILTGYEWVSSGSVTVFGNHFGQCLISDVRKSIGWVSSAVLFRFPGRDTALDIVLSGIESSLGLFRDFSSEEISRAKECLALMQIADCDAKPFKILSQGEQQRVLIARALVHHPRLLILDEPCAGLDPAAREHLLTDLKILTLEENPPTIIFVTHHIEDIAPFITHAFILKDGSGHALGPVETAVTSETLSSALNCNCYVQHDNTRFSLTVRHGGTE